MTHNAISEILELFLRVKFLLRKYVCVREQGKPYKLANEIDEDVLVRSFMRYWIASVA